MTTPFKEIDNILFCNTDLDKNQENFDKYTDYQLEQYRIYLHVFNSTNERRQRSNEFFLGLNTAIIGALGYIETKQTFDAPLIFILASVAGLSICYAWYRIICSYKNLNRAKFKVIHSVEKKLPLSLFETEWELLGRGKDFSKYIPLSQIEKVIPATFILIYGSILLFKVPWKEMLAIINF